MAPRSLKSRAASAAIWLACVAGLAQCGSHKSADVSRGAYANVGSVCGSSAIQGTKLDRIRQGDCGVSNPVLLTSVAGVRLEPAPVVDCQAAKALNKWVSKSAQPALRSSGGLDSLRVAAGYVCRTRNGQPGAKLSEHAQGKAVDISAFGLKNGRTITVQQGWHSGDTSQVLRKLHKSACGTFGTVLGPNSDSFHRDHFHLDTARHRNGSYCR